MSSGILRVQSFTSRLAAPLGFVDVTVSGQNFSTTFQTDAQGNAPDIRVEAPDRSYSLNQHSAVRPYALCRLQASKPGWLGLELNDIQIFDGQTTLAQLEMLPGSSENPQVPTAPHAPLFEGGGGSGPAPESASTPSKILRQVVIPETITVHLGRPAASARNVTVSFRHYIANVASSEVYPTWPENALRANIHAQISLALNRIYTEWYRSRGYDFDITNSTSYDQYFVYKRTIFEVMERLTGEIFNTYVQKGGSAEPYYTEYCDGKSVNCPGMKQWGTVELANSGYSPLQILRYYYGSDIAIRRTQNIAAVQQSYPGSSLRVGDSGTNVAILQRQLNRIAKDYPSFGTLAVDGVFGAAMQQTVKRFQRQFGLTADGVVGRATWYKISLIYASVKKLAELTSEGEPSGSGVSSGSWGGTVLREGSTGVPVEQVQFWLNVLAQFDARIPAVTVDGVFGAATTRAVKAFQSAYGLVSDGVVGKATWQAIYAAYQNMESDLNNNSYPGTPLRLGSEGVAVRQVQFWLRVAADNYIALEGVSVDGAFGSATRQAVLSFQDYFSLTADGVVGLQTWNKLYTVFLAVANNLLGPNEKPGDFPGTLREGSTGTAVRELQYYLYLLGTYYSGLSPVAVDGIFGSRTTAAVKAWQRINDLTVDGVVGRTTWNSIWQQARRLRVPAEPRLLGSAAWPGKTLGPGASGPAVRYLRRLLDIAAFWVASIPEAGAGEEYTPETEKSMAAFQQFAALPETGAADRASWETLEQSVSLWLNEK